MIILAISRCFLWLHQLSKFGLDINLNYSVIPIKMQYAVSLKKTQNVFRITKLRSWELNVLHLCNSDFTRANKKLRQLRPFERKEQRCNWSVVALSEIQIISTIFHLLLSAITSKLIIFSWLNILHFWWLKHEFYHKCFYFRIHFFCKINVCIWKRF